MEASGRLSEASVIAWKRVEESGREWKRVKGSGKRGG